VSGFKSSDTSPQFDTPYQMDFVDMKKLYYQLHDEYTALRTECAELQATVESMQIEHETRSNQMRAEAAARGLIWHHDRWTHPDLIPTLGKVSFANQQHLAEEEERLHFQVENEHLQRETRRLRGQASQPASVAASTTSTPRPAQPNTELPPTAPQTEVR
jgi:regulator of replication initiation timing